MDYTSRCNLREMADGNQVCCRFLENGNSFVPTQLGLASLPVIYSGNGLQLLKRAEKEGEFSQIWQSIHPIAAVRALWNLRS